jgi:hypothetical protein
MTSVSSLTSISSRTSVETYESLKEEIIRIVQSQIDLPELVDTAEKVVSEKFTPALQRVYTYKKGSETISIDLDVVMKAMLVHSEKCGGQRYVASAILACSQKESYKDVVETLAALGTTWLTHLLFVCQFYGLAMNRKNLIFSAVKTSRSHESQSDEEPYDLATPTLQETTSHMGEGMSSFKDDVRRQILK